MGETSLTDKLGIRQGRRVLVLDPPAGFVKRLDPLPEGVGVTTKIVSLADVILVFSSSRAVLGELFPKFSCALRAEKRLQRLRSGVSLLVRSRRDSTPGEEGVESFPGRRQVVPFNARARV